MYLWLLLSWISADIATSTVLPESSDAVSCLQTHRKLTPRTEQGHRWRKTEELAFTHNSGANATADLYFIRHGQNVANEWWKHHPDAPEGFPQEKDGGFWDGGLTKLGVQQAVLLQDSLERQLGLGKVPPDTVQLAASLNSRAFDTLVIASAPLWRAWSSAGTAFRLHGVPAAMELDTTINSRRPPGVAVDDPMPWEDSALAGNYSMLAKAGDARSLFYQTAGDRERSLQVTTKPVQVQAAYKRETSDLTGGSCKSEQLDNLASYLTASVQAGKKHILLGAHGLVILCMIEQYGSKATVARASGKEFALTKGGIPNAGVLHVVLHTSPDKPIVLEPHFLYESPLVSH